MDSLSYKNDILVRKCFMNLCENNILPQDYSEYINRGPWILNEEIANSMLLQYNDLMSRVVDSRNKKSLKFLRDSSQIYEKINNKSTLSLIELAEFVEKCELAYRHVGQFATTMDFNYISYNKLSEAILSDGFPIDWVHIANRQMSPVVKQIKNMYEFLDKYNVPHEIPQPHAMYVNCALCKYLQEDNLMWDNMETDKNISRWAEEKLSIPRDSPLIEELVQVFTNFSNQYQFMKSVAVWRNSVKVRLDQYYSGKPSILQKVESQLFDSSEPPAA